MNLPALQKFTPLIVGISGTTVDAETRAVLQQLNPVGFILFKRNCENREQLKALCDDLIALCPTSKPLIFIDQEGGRVVRIAWEDYIAPAGCKFGEIYSNYSPEHALTLARLSGFVLAGQLQEYGITVNCLPVADVAIEGTHDVIGDRAFSKDPKIVSLLCSATISGMLAGGNWPIIKHAPGHGRANADSHKQLPVVDASLEELMQNDFLPFIENALSPFVMTAHIKYPQLDAENCATQSPYIIDEILRKKIGLTGVIVSDDLNMEALEGSIRHRAEKSLSAGCDLLLHCSGKVEEMKTLIGLTEIKSDVWQKINNLPPLSGMQPDMLENAKKTLKKHLETA